MCKIGTQKKTLNFTRWGCNETSWGWFEFISGCIFNTLSWYQLGWVAMREWLELG